MWDFGVLSAPVYEKPVYRDWGLYGLAAKSWDFLETFPPEGAKIFYRDLFKGSLNLYYRSYGVPLNAIR